MSIDIEERIENLDLEVIELYDGESANKRKELIKFLETIMEEEKWRNLLKEKILIIINNAEEADKKTFARIFAKDDELLKQMLKNGYDKDDIVCGLMSDKKFVGKILKEDRECVLKNLKEYEENGFRNLSDVFSFFNTIEEMIKIENETNVEKFKDIENCTIKKEYTVLDETSSKFEEYHNLNEYWIEEYGFFSKIFEQNNTKRFLEKIEQDTKQWIEKELELTSKDEELEILKKNMKMYIATYGTIVSRIIKQDRNFRYSQKQVMIENKSEPFKLLDMGFWGIVIKSGNNVIKLGDRSTPNPPYSTRYLKTNFRKLYENKWPVNNLFMEVQGFEPNDGNEEAIKLINADLRKEKIIFKDECKSNVTEVENPENLEPMPDWWRGEDPWGWIEIQGYKRTRDSYEIPNDPYRIRDIDYLEKDEEK